LNRNPKKIKPSALAIEALGVMNRQNITTLLVSDETDRLVGVIHIHNLLAAGI
jgi:arabinose-5-phosphate isomerase